MFAAKYLYLSRLFSLCVSPKWYHIKHATLYPDHLIYNAE